MNTNQEEFTAKVVDDICCQIQKIINDLDNRKRKNVRCDLIANKLNKIINGV